MCSRWWTVWGVSVVVLRQSCDSSAITSDGTGVANRKPAVSDLRSGNTIIMRVGSGTHSDPFATRDSPGMRRLVVTAWGLVAWSFAIRLLNFTAPLLEIHSFRQTHNGIVIDWMVRNGPSLTNFEAPIFGEPWRLVVDFPLYQFCAAWVVRWTGLGVDVSARVVALTMFGLSAVVLYRLMRRIDPNGQTPLIGLLFYLYSPLSMVWSRAGMLDGTAILLSLCFLSSFVRLLRRVTPGWWILGTVCACTAAVVKSITLAVFLVAASALLIQRITRLLELRRRHPRLNSAINRQLAFLAAACVASVLCLAISVQSWKAFADSINLASPYTSFHASTELGSWLFGTWQQRLDPANWVLLGWRMATLAFPLAIIAFPLWPLLRPACVNRRVRALVRGSWLGLLLSVLVFFNLFVRHDYYLWAAVPLLSIAAAYGARCWWQRLAATSGVQVPSIAAGSAAILVGSFLFGAIPYVYWTVRFDQNDPLCRLGRLIAAETPHDEYVIVADFGWHTSILYYSGRRGFMVDPAQSQAEPPWRQFAEQPYRTIVVRDPHPELFARWGECRKVGSEAGFDVYRVSRPVRSESSEH